MVWISVLGRSAVLRLNFNLNFIVKVFALNFNSRCQDDRSDTFIAKAFASQRR